MRHMKCVMGEQVSVCAARCRPGYNATIGDGHSTGAYTLGSACGGVWWGGGGGGGWGSAGGALEEGRCRHEEGRVASSEMRAASARCALCGSAIAKRRGAACGAF